MLILRIAGIVLLLLLYFWMAWRYERFAGLNARVRTFALSHRSPLLDPVMKLTHILNGAVLMSMLTAAVALLLGALWDAWKQALVMTAAMVFETAVAHATKALHKSERPPQRIANILMKTHSYPSGHSAASMTFALIVPYFLAMHLQLPVAVGIGVVLMVNALLTAYGRIYLDMHWLIDIFGGWCMAGITAICTGILMSVL